MEAMNTFQWAQDKLADMKEEACKPTMDRETMACERRLKQMRAKRAKQERRATQAAEKESKVQG